MTDFDTDSIISAVNAFIPVMILMMLLGVVFKSLGSIKF
jgi:hypothetical protein